MPISIKDMNNKMKSFINEANGISSKCKLKLIKLVEKHFLVDLPNDNYKNIDIVILKNGNIIMRDIEYKTSLEVSSLEDLEVRFNNFSLEVSNLLDKKATNFDTMKKSNERNNLIMVIFITFAIIVIGIYSIRELILGNLFGVLWLIIIIGYYILPSTGNNIRNRYVKAYNYIKSKFHK